MYRDIKIKLYAFYFRQTNGGRRENRALIFIAQWAARGRRNKLSNKTPQIIQNKILRIPR